MNTSYTGYFIMCAFKKKKLTKSRFLRLPTVETLTMVECCITEVFVPIKTLEQAWQHRPIIPTTQEVTEWVQDQPGQLHGLNETLPQNYKIRKRARDMNQGKALA